MRILITNNVLADGSGTETLVRDLALELRRRRHSVLCYAPILGRLATELRSTGTPVVNSLMAVGEAPDIIHGHHTAPTMVALARFPEAQAVFVCHDWSAVYDDPPLHPRVGRYLYVRNVLRERLVSERQLAADRVGFWGNTVDFSRIGAPKAPPSQPRVAGVYGHPGAMPFLDVVRRCCRRRGIDFRGDLLGESVDRLSPEQTLAQCDLVFARGRMAIEAIGAGCAVINLDQFGIGGLVTSDRFDEFVSANFAIGALSAPASEIALLEAIDAYSAEDATEVTARVRRECDIQSGASRIEAIYEDVLKHAKPTDSTRECLDFAQYLEQNVKLGRLYDGGMAREIKTPTTSDELVAAVRKLDTRIDQLNSAMDEISYRWSLSRSGIASFMMFVLRASRKNFRRWVNARVRFTAYRQRDVSHGFDERHTRDKAASTIAARRILRR